MELLFFNVFILMLLCGLEMTPVSAYPRRRYLNRKLLLALGLSYLCFLGMFRGVSCGNDTVNYRDFFLKVASQNSLWHTIQDTSFEPLFAALTFIISRFTKNPQSLFIITSVFSFAVVGRFLAKYSQMPCFSLYLFFAMQVFDFFISGVRQTLAIAVLLLSYEAMVNKKNTRAAVLILLASFFHRTAWLMMLVFFLLHIRRRKNYFAVVVLFSAICLIVIRPLLTVIAKIFPRYQLYFDSSYLKSGVKLSLILYFLVFGLMILLGEMVSRKENALNWSKTDEWDFRLSFLLLAVCILGYAAPIFSRLLQYFQINLCVYFSNRVFQMRGRTRRILILASLIAFATYDITIHTLRTPEWYTTYPFVFCWNH